MLRGGRRVWTWLGIACVLAGVGPAQAAEVHFNQRGSERLDTHILAAIDEAAETAASGEPVSIDILIFQFTHPGIADRVLEVAAAHPSLTVRVVGDWSSLNKTDGYTDPKTRKKYFTPSGNRPTYLHHVASGNYREACEIGVAVARVPKFRPVAPAPPDADADPEAWADYESDHARYEADAETAADYKAKKKACRQRLEEEYGGEPLSNVHVRFKVDRPYVYSPRQRRAVYSHRASQGLNHHKGMVVRVGGRPERLLSGSYNWSLSAEEDNYENLMTFDRRAQDERVLLDDYGAEFDGMFYDNGLTVTADEARVLGTWMRKHVIHEAGNGPDPGPRPPRSDPRLELLTDEERASWMASACDPQVDNACELVRAVDIAAILAAPGSASNSRPEPAAARVSINGADAETLATLPGIGETLAQRIVSHRAQHGDFGAVDDLLAVPGVGSGTVAVLRPHVTPEVAQVFFSSRRLDEEAGRGYAPVNANKTLWVRDAVGEGGMLQPGSLTAPVVDLVRSARPGTPLQIAAYGLSTGTHELNEIFDAARRGVPVQIVLNDDYSEGTVAAIDRAVREEGLNIEVRIPTATMHEKFGVAGNHVFNGSANLSTSATRKHSEDRFYFRHHEALASAFAGRFEQLWEASETRVVPVDPNAYVIPYDDPDLRVAALFSPFEPVERHVLRALDAAQTRVRLAMFNLRSEALIDKLIELHEDGVEVEVVMDRREARRRTNTTDERLEAAGIPVLEVRPTGGDMMHHKFLVIDDSRVLTGSYNWSETASLANDENLLFVDRPGVARAFNREFEELTGRRPNDPGNGYRFEGLRVAFSPEDDLDELVLEQLRQADESVQVAMFAFFHEEIANELIRLAEDGKTVEVLVYDTQARRTELDEKLEAAGVKVVRAKSPMGIFTAMHQKFAVVDGKTVVTGSFNWSENATSENNEALLIAEDAQALADRYQDAFAGLMARNDPDFDPDRYADTADDTAGVLLGVRAPRQLPEGAGVFVVGDHPQLGDGDPARAVPLRTGRALQGTWTAAVQLPADARVEYRYFVRDAAGAITWQEGDAQMLEIGPHAYDEAVRDGVTWPGGLALNR